MGTFGDIYKQMGGRLWKYR